ncbi:MAG: hypothetical protein IJD04_05275, partial [Desulfovibrionaceae bacterium]|nr:hypothetical protein [Desulfovibrionaceae bacterium]
VTLYTMGLPMSAIAGLFQVSTPAVLRWVRTFAEREHEKPQPAEVVFVEPDEMRRLLKSKKTNIESGKPVVVISLDSLTGNVEGAIRLASPE